MFLRCFDSLSTASRASSSRVERRAGMRARALEAFLVDARASCADVRTDAESLREVSSDMGVHHGALPNAVARPTTARACAGLVRACAKHAVPCVPRGAGTGLEGGAVAYSGGLVVDTTALKTIDVDATNLTATVGAGVLKSELNKALAPYGFLFGPDPSSNPSIGGMCATGGSGLSTLKYGTSKENVRSMLVVTPQGELIRTRAKTRKSSTGYELNALYLGAEGTLGLIVEITVRIVPLPKLRCGAVVRFPSVGQAAQTTSDVVAMNLSTLLRCELMNDEGIKVTNTVFKTTLPCAPTLFLEFVGNRKEEMLSDWDSFRARAVANGAESHTFAEDGAQLDALWDARRGCYLGAMRYRGLESGTNSKEKVYVGDVCVPASKLSECIAITEREFKKARFPCVICAHIADGNFHCLIPFQESERAALLALEDKVIGHAIALGGSASGEHGVGIGKQKYLILEHGGAHIDVQRRIKRALDPLNIMNPGKIISWDPSDAERIGPQRPELARL